MLHRLLPKLEDFRGNTWFEILKLAWGSLLSIGPIAAFVAWAKSAPLWQVFLICIIGLVLGQLAFSLILRVVERFLPRAVLVPGGECEIKQGGFSRCVMLIHSSLKDRSIENIDVSVTGIEDGWEGIPRDGKLPVIEENTTTLDPDSSLTVNFFECMAAWDFQGNPNSQPIPHIKACLITRKPEPGKDIKNCKSFVLNKEYKVRIKITGKDVAASIHTARMGFYLKDKILMFRLQNP